MRPDDNYNTLQRIKEWNATRLDLFKISEPNRRNEFHGVVRFFFQGDDSKYQAKCLRISNTTTACQLVNTLVEKFYPDLKMLTAGRFALYEYHTSSGERRLGANEAPLLVQLNYAYDNNEVRFILRDESKPLPTARQHQALENQPGALQNGTARYRSSQKLVDSAEDSAKSDRGFARRWSSGSRKKKKRKEGQEEQNGTDLTPVPDSSFTRTLSNPDEVLRRRRQQRMQNRLQSGTPGEERVDIVKIYGDSINPEVPFVTISLTIDDTADKVVAMALEKYGLIKQVNPKDFCLVQMNIAPRGERLPPDVEREQTLHNQDSLVGIRLLLRRQREDVSCIFQLRHRRATGKDGRKPPAPAPVHPRAPPSAFKHGSRTRSSGPGASESTDTESVPYLIEVQSSTDHSSRPDGMVISLAGLFDRTYPAPIQLGTIEKMVGPPPNILVDKNLHPDIRPVHCTFSAVLASTSGSKWSIPKSGQPGDFDAVTSYSLLITPSLDGFARPPGPAQVRVNGQRITGPMLVPSDGFIQLGKTMFLKFVYLETDTGRVEEPAKVNVTLPRIANGAPGAYSMKATTMKPLEGHSTPGTRTSQTEKTNEHDSHVRLRKTSVSAAGELPLTIELQDLDRIDREDFLEHYTQIVDEILNGVGSDLHTLTHRTKDENRPALFSLSPAYALYLVYRACEKHMESSPDLVLAEKEHNVSYITNYIATRMYESLPSTTRGPADHMGLIQPFVYWLANSSELLQFFKNDVNLCSPSDKSQPTRSRSPIHACRQALHLLADAVDHCFYELRTCVTSILQPMFHCLTYPGDSDLQEDLRLDDRPINPQQISGHPRDPIKLQTLMQFLSWLMHLLRRTRVNASLTIQLFAQLFHTLNAYIFNHALINTEARPRHTRDEQNIWLTRLGAIRLVRRLERIKHWAQRFGLERAAECRLQRCVQACQLIQADRSNLDDFYQFCMGLLSLNSIQLEWLLAHLGDPPPVPDDWIDLIVTGGKEVNDRAILDEMDHYLRASQQDLSIPELQLSEIKDLPLPLLLPPDGYASDAVLTGTPSGLSEFLRPLVSKGLIFVRRNPAGTGQSDSRPWIRCLRLSKVEDIEAQSTDEVKRKLEVPPPTSRSASHIPSSPHGESGDNGSDLSDTDSEDSLPTNRRLKQRQYQPKTVNSRKSTLLGQTTRQHRSLPDLTNSDFGGLAKEANVPVRSITRFYLRKHNNSLGLSIVAAKAEGDTQYGIYVKDIVPGGAADRDGRLDMGDQILAIGSANLVGCAQSDAVATLAKQSQSEEGVLLTVAQGAAKFHGILELIRPPGSERPSPIADETVSPAVKPRHSTKPLTTPSDAPPPHAGPHKVGATVHPPSTRMGLKPVDDQERMPSGASKQSPIGRMAGRERPKQFGALSRSTPTLNLAEISDKDSEASFQESGTGDFTSSEAQETRRLTTRRSEPKGSVDSGKSSTWVRSMQREEPDKVDSNRRNQKPVKPEEHSRSPSPGSDIVRESLVAPKHRKHGHSNVRQRKATEPSTQRPKSGVALHTARSQPDMSHVPSKQPTVRRSSLAAEPAELYNNAPQADSCSDVFSSLESVSSPQTPCSLQDSAELEKERMAPSDMDPRPNLTHSGRREERVRHPPPPSASSQKAKPPLSRAIPRGRTSARHLSESELTSTRKQESSEPHRPLSSTQNRSNQSYLKETDVDFSDLSEEAELPGQPDSQNVRRDSRSSLKSDDSRYGRQADQESDAHYRSGTPATSGSMTPTSVDTVVSKPAPPKSAPDAREDTVPKRLHDGTGVQLKEPAGNTFNQRETLKSTVADVSHPQPSSGGTQTPLDDTISESLRPPTHAIVSGPRYTDDQPPSYLPALIPDVPVLHRDPQRGRSKRDLDENGSFSVQQPIISKKPATDSLVHAEFVEATPQSELRPPSVHPSSLESQVRKSQSVEQDVERRPQNLTRYTKPSSLQPRDFSGTGSRPIGVTSPPPTPTAECPQYHPPDRLEPVDWTGHQQSQGSAISTQFADRYERTSRAPQVAPKPQVSAPSTLHSQRPPYTPKPPQPSSISQPSIQSTIQNVKPSTSSSLVPAQTHLPQLGAAQRVAQLEAEIAAMEASQAYSKSGEISPTLDRLRVELQFQRRLAERESLRRNPVSMDDRGLHHVTTSTIRETSQSVPSKTAVDGGLRDTHIVWEEKRIQAERDLEASQRRRLAELEEEHRAMLARQEQRARERAEWFGKNQGLSDVRQPNGTEAVVRQRSQSIGSGSHSPERASYPSATDIHTRYGRPCFDVNQRQSQFGHTTPQYPVQSRTGPQVVETELSRAALTTPTGGDSLRMKKSVSFDKNLETITVYSPPTTPQESFAENAPTTSSRSFLMDSSASYTGPPHDRSATAKGHYPGNYAKPSPIPVDHSARQTSISPNPIPNAELLPFKEKMRLFAQQIGEDLPRERSKLSSRQKELLMINTTDIPRSSPNYTRP
ncbi:hypothetical protein CRM22_002251 [Opisthorchis felineus]|uniref:Afadin n=1 Tax=Opisthorchis felineus TaxID=147828 RepID=A0A4V3SGF6_OPIFE|nr:hypothetical protein CRM22_002251 [Opisthorchis felineus]